MPDTTKFEWDSGKAPASLVDDLQDLEDAVDKYLVEAMETWALMVESSAKSMVAVDSGRLRSSIASEVKQSGTIITAYIGSNVSYAPIIEYGRGPVEADEGYLRFVIDGEVYYRKRVAGVEAQPYLRPAVDSHLSDIRRLLKEALTKAVKEVS